MASLEDKGLTGLSYFYAGYRCFFTTGKALVLERGHYLLTDCAVQHPEQVLVRGVLVRQLQRRKLRCIRCV